mmetsp:Transcript_148961/g.415084  ORF Transcript_148961/g.415084 Transcript_148961/m.415084 type:complete len:230 (+) Transcript_148961:313-1002(+)
MTFACVCLSGSGTFPSISSSQISALHLSFLRHGPMCIRRVCCKVSRQMRSIAVSLQACCRSPLGRKLGCAWHLVTRLGGRAPLASPAPELLEPAWHREWTMGGVAGSAFPAAGACWQRAEEHALLRRRFPTFQRRSRTWWRNTRNGQSHRSLQSHNMCSKSYCMRSSFCHHHPHNRRSDNYASCFHSHKKVLFFGRTSATCRGLGSVWRLLEGRADDPTASTLDARHGA